MTSMATLPMRPLLAPVALLALLAAASSVGCCATQAGGTQAACTAHAVATAPRVFRLDNRGVDRLDVYLLDDTREWYLGRVEPGSLAPLPLPRDRSFGAHGMVRLAVLAGVAPGAAHRLRPSREPGAVFTVWQPLTRLLG